MAAVPFQTKLDQAAQLVAWVANWLRFLKKTIWLVTDRAYAKRPFLEAARRARGCACRNMSMMGS
jgi:hypothetical protein